jgi:hypothetical protein
MQCLNNLGVHQRIGDAFLKRKIEVLVVLFVERERFLRLASFWQWHLVQIRVLNLLSAIQVMGKITPFAQKEWLSRVATGKHYAADLQSSEPSIKVAFHEPGGPVGRRVSSRVDEHAPRK